MKSAKAAMRDAGMALLKRLYLLPAPLIIACTGHSVAAGGLLLLTGDTRIGIRGDFTIGLNETRIGLALPITGLELARDRLEETAVTRAVIQAELYDPEGAVAVGYLDHAVDAGAFDMAIADAAQALTALRPGGLCRDETTASASRRWTGSRPRNSTSETHYGPQAVSLAGRNSQSGSCDAYWKLIVFTASSIFSFDQTCGKSGGESWS